MKGWFIFNKDGKSRNKVFFCFNRASVGYVSNTAHLLFIRIAPLPSTFSLLRHFQSFGGGVIFSNHARHFPGWQIPILKILQVSFHHIAKV